MKRFIFLCLIGCWILVAVFSVLYNVGKVGAELNEWGALSDNEKRYKIFGDDHELAAFITHYTVYDAEILFYSSDGMAFYYNRYALYPRLLTWVQNEKELRSAAALNQFKYIIVYDASLVLPGYDEVASFSSQLSEKHGLLYRKQ